MNKINTMVCKIIIRSVLAIEIQFVKIGRLKCYNFRNIIVDTMVRLNECTPVDIYSLPYMQWIFNTTYTGMSYKETVQLVYYYHNM